MTADYIKAKSRGYVNMDWLKSFHSFSFANYYDPDRMHFGVLRVLNDDQVAGGKGFDSHSHKNMEIISIPLAGSLKHKDSTGNEHVLNVGDVQVMSAGAGISHSEYNNNETDLTQFLQIWILPREQEVAPRYQQVSFKPEDRKDVFQEIISPLESDNNLWIHQDAYMHWTDLSKGKSLSYSRKSPENGLYFFVISGNCTINGQNCNTRDALALEEVDSTEITATDDSFILCIEVPMRLPSL
jgi:redox-sensitive bicupin YhaK (pirin superfamily)